MNEQDKEFIKSLKTQCKGARKIFKDTCCQLPISYIEKIMDIVDKQEKEIEELKKVGSNCVSKDRIREVLEYYGYAPVDDTKSMLAFYSDINKLLKGIKTVIGLCDEELRLSLESFGVYDDILSEIDDEDMVFESGMCLSSDIMEEYCYMKGIIEDVSNNYVSENDIGKILIKKYWKNHKCF